MVLRPGDIPSGDLARSEWAALPKAVRRRLRKDAHRHRPIADPAVAAVAVGWAWAVLGPPGSRRRVTAWDVVGFLLDVVLSTPGGNIGVDIFDGKPRYDANPVVRGMAKRIEAANPVEPAAPPG